MEKEYISKDEILCKLDSVSVPIRYYKHYNMYRCGYIDACNDIKKIVNNLKVVNIDLDEILRCEDDFK